ncbi:DUF2235 domain-containing protein [Sagittula salina]|uniref:DUF2235 domain-containing protein n=1 Tax=Sagittula salina TaxID=2820268 RepID=A0A940S028_9RHOB|nr:DUF2235 domain-containing protein [Sagittula salina]MBP0481731.1 DUF2235 domain-containing protein [Sagittula salina]
MSHLGDRLAEWLLPDGPSRHSDYAPKRGPRDHVIILDGTASSLQPGFESNAGLTWKLLREQGELSLYYEAGIQWRDWRQTGDVILGHGIDGQIRRAYGYLASRYRVGDRIFLLGFSRGAFAVRSLAGIIDRVGLLRARHATERAIRQVYRLYEYDPDGATAEVFARKYCHDVTLIEMLGVWDTVKALGLRLPGLWRLAEPRHAFHNHALGRSVRHGFHALALDETRHAFAPVLWERPAQWDGILEQVWFRGTHGDVGGMLGAGQQARPLANIPLVWMLERLEACAVPLPPGWRRRFPCDVEAPSVGTWQGFGKLFVLRSPRVVGGDPSERLHESVEAPWLVRESGGDATEGRRQG